MQGIHFTLNRILFSNSTNAQRRPPSTSALRRPPSTSAPPPSFPFNLRDAVVRLQLRGRCRPPSVLPQFPFNSETPTSIWLLQEPSPSSSAG
ncbi:unnamed protein product [Linum trigynum]|uniref:Uncharacterized protein n=1 Tax=Linum trigynum TaxID=586398 RepID=A0AAV2EAH8_9ROSI